MSTEDTTPKSDLLWAEHRAILAARGVPIEFAVKHGICSVDLKAIKASDDRRKTKTFPNTRMPPTSAMYMPYPECHDRVKRWRLRVDETEFTIPGEVEGTHHGEESGTCPRYLCQAGITVVPYITDEVKAVAGDVSVPLYIVEAPLKALSLSSRGLLAVGLGGVVAGTHDRDVLKELGEIVAHPDLRLIEWRGRTAYVVFDAGVASNPLVALGAARVWRALSDLGAIVKLITIPYYHPQDSDPLAGKFWGANDQGPDDYLARRELPEVGCVETFQRCVTESADPLARFQGLAHLPPAERAIQAGIILRDLYVVAALSVAGETTVAAITALKLGLTKSGIKEAIGEFQDRLAARANKDEPEWVTKFRRAVSGAIRPIRENVELALLNDPELQGVLGFDTFGGAMMKVKSPPWQGGAGPWSDLDDIRLASYLADKYELVDVHPPKTRAAVIGVSRSHEYHPIQDYLNGLVWDCKPRVADWLASYMGVDSNSYVTNVGQWWLVSAIARAMVPGAKVDHTLILDGDQGAAKSSALEVLGGDWFSDADLGDLKSKESALAMQGCWILELAEGEIFDRASTKTLKKYATKRRDDIVLKFSNLKTRMERQVVFALTCNEFQFVDKTGNRRFWPVKVGTIDLDALKADRDQLWAEATALYNSGAKWWPVTEHEKKLCKDVQAKHEAQDVWVEKIAAGLMRVETTSASEVLDLLDIPTRSRNHIISCRVCECLRRIGWIEGTSRKDGVRRWGRGITAEPMLSEADVAELGRLRVIEGGAGFDDDEPIDFIGQV